jgi:hypothetical protein
MTTWATATFSMARPEKPIEPRDFMPSLSGKKRSRKELIRREQEAAQRLSAKFRALNP